MLPTGHSYSGTPSLTNWGRVARNGASGCVL
jgi:hypothetical protein